MKAKIEIKKSKPKKVVIKKVQEKACSTFDSKELENILKLLKENDVSEFKLVRGEDSLALKRSGLSSSGNFKTLIQGISAASTTSTARNDSFVTASPAEKQGLSIETTSNFKEVKSEIVGTFYARPSPDSPVFASIGSYVEVGDVLCIVEAMKVMNEIVSPIAGKIVEVCLQDGQMVEYGEVLFRLE